jgi:alpha-ketoglutarate-dependent 2,4-dichlorophenoxyacetate dioxygenase
MTLTFKPLTEHIGAEASGLDLRQPIDAMTAAAIEAAMDRYAVLVWRGQKLSEEEQLDFTKWFGPFDEGMARALKPRTKYRHDHFGDISNTDAEGKLMSRDDRRVFSMLANQLWHSDSSFKNPPAKYSILAGVVVPEGDGDTQWADERAAYDALPDSTKKLIDGLFAEHSVNYSREMLGSMTFTEEEKRRIPVVHWPIIRTHAGSGRKHLFVGAHCSRIVGMTKAEGRLLLAELLEHTTQREFVYRHRWRTNDLVMWDNRCVLHRGLRYDLSKARDLRRSTTEDTASVPVAIQAA